MEQIRTITRELATGPQAVLQVEGRSGEVVVVAHDLPTVHVEATVRVWSALAVEADDAAALVERAIEQDGHRATVRAPSLPQSEGWALWGRRSGRIDYRIKVPQETAVRVLSRSGRVEVRQTHGRVHVECGSGRIELTEIVGAVTAASRSGAINVRAIAGDLSLEARSGRVEVREVIGRVDIDNRTGAVDVREVRGDVKVRARTGIVSVQQVDGTVDIETHTGTARYSGRVCGDITIRAHTGSIVLAADPAHPFFVDAESSLGIVRSELTPRPRVGGGASSERGPRVRLRTHTGAIRITRL